MDVEQRHDVEAGLVGARWSVRATLHAEDKRLRWVNGTSFGNEVVPEV